MVLDAGQFILLQAIQEIFHAVIPCKPGESPNSRLIQHAPCAREITAFPAAGEPFFSTAIEIFTPIPVDAALIPAANASIVLAANGTGETTECDSF